MYRSCHPDTVGILPAPFTNPPRHPTPLGRRIVSVVRCGIRSVGVSRCGGMQSLSLRYVLYGSEAEVLFPNAL
jgi:hypothetical protein